MRPQHARALSFLGAVGAIASVAFVVRWLGAPAARAPSSEAPPAPRAPSDTPSLRSPPPSRIEGDGGAPPVVRILSAYHGLDRLPPRVARICPAAAIGDDGMPVTFSVQLDTSTVHPGAFVVETASGDMVTPVCATLAPADEVLEGYTVLLAGPFGTGDATPRAVRVVGAVRGRRGERLQGVSTTTITPLASGPRVVLAQRFAPTTPGLAGECPAGTLQVVQLTWQGGVKGPNGADLGEAQRAAITITLDDGRTVTPMALADDDPDNFVHACLDVSTPARSVAVRAGHFHDPGDDANPATECMVIDGPR